MGLNAAELLLMFQLQQMNNTWQSSSNIGQRDIGIGTSSKDLLFALLLQTALDDKNSTLPNNVMPTTSESQDLGPNSKKPESINQIIASMGQKYGVDSRLINQLVNAESSFNSSAVSPAGAMGLMQLMPGTAESYGVKNPFDPVQNIEGGVRYLRDLLNKFEGNVPLALAAYNAGPGAVEKHNGIPPYSETQAYVKKILAGLNSLDTNV